MALLSKRNSFFTYEDAEVQVDSADPAEVEANITEEVTLDNEIQNDTATIEDADAVVSDLQTQADDATTLIEQAPEEVTEEIAQEANKKFILCLGRLGAGHYDLHHISMGNESHSTPLAKLTATREGIWQTIKEFFAKIWRWIKDIVSKIYQFIKVKILRIKPKEKEVAQTPPNFSDRVKTKLKSLEDTLNEPFDGLFSKESFNINLESKKSDRGLQRLNIPYILSAAYNENIDADDLIKFLQIAPSADVVIESDKIIAQFIKDDNFNIDKLESVLHRSISGIQGAINTKFNKGILNCLDTSTITLATNIPEVLKETGIVEVNTSSIPNEAVFIGLSGIESGEYMTANSVSYKARFKKLPQNDILPVIEAFIKSDAFGKLVAKADRMVFSKALELNMKSMEKLEKNIDKVAQVMERQFKAVVGEPDPEKAKYMHAIGTIFKEVALLNIKFSKNQIIFISQLLDFILLVNRKYAE